MLGAVAPGYNIPGMNVPYAHYPPVAPRSRPNRVERSERIYMPHGGRSDEVERRTRSEQLARANAQRAATLARLRGYGASDMDIHDEL